MGKQHYKCTGCGAVFTLGKKWNEKAYEDYCFKAHSYEEIALKYGKTMCSVQKSFDRLRVQMLCPILKDQYVNVCLDGVYFGWSTSFTVIRANGQNIYFEQTTETVKHISECLKKAEVLGYRYKSFTIDGRKGGTDVTRTVSGCTYPILPVPPKEDRKVLLNPGT